MGLKVDYEIYDKISLVINIWGDIFLLVEVIPDNFVAMDLFHRHFFLLAGDSP